MTEPEVQQKPVWAVRFECFNTIRRAESQSCWKTRELLLCWQKMNQWCHFDVMRWWDQDPSNPPNSDLMEEEMKHDIPAQSNVMGTWTNLHVLNSWCCTREVNTSTCRQFPQSHQEPWQELVCKCSKESELKVVEVWFEPGDPEQQLRFMDRKRSGRSKQGGRLHAAAAWGRVGTLSAQVKKVRREILTHFLFLLLGRQISAPCPQESIHPSSHSHSFCFISQKVFDVFTF